MSNIGADANFSLSRLETLAQQQEQILGPLIGLGNDGIQTVIVLDDDKDPPGNDNLVILRPTVAGVAIELVNHVLICKGECFVTGIKQELAVYRPAALALTPEATAAASPEVQPGKTVGSTTVSEPAPVPTVSSQGKLAWGARVSDEFRRKVRKIAGDLGCDPNFLMAAMAFETGGSFSPSEKNKAGSGATGLIQFMPNTAIGMGTTTAALAKMSAEDQLDFVAKYFDRQKGKLHTLEDVYMAILLPTAVGKADNHVLFTEGTKAYDQNKGLDLNKDGQVTKAEAAAKVRARLIEGMRPGNVE